MSKNESGSGHLQDECPAFADGCPYAAVMNEASAGLASKCPAFRDGCPFKGATDVETISRLLETVPKSHLCGGQMMGSAKALYDLLLAVHEQSQAKKGELGECPVFSMSCPFKNVTSSGTPLVSELEYVSFDRDIPLHHGLPTLTLIHPPTHPRIDHRTPPRRPAVTAHGPCLAWRRTRRRTPLPPGSMAERPTDLGCPST